MFNFSEELGWPQFGKLPLLRRQNFLKVFSPLRFRWVLPAGLGPWGRNFPRPHTAALRSPQRPRCGPRAAHRGQGGGGCEGRRRPWPRTKDFWGGKTTSWGNGIFTWRSGWNVDSIHGSSFRWIFFLIFCWKLSAKTFAYPTPIPLEYQVGWLLYKTSFFCSSNVFLILHYWQYRLNIGFSRGCFLM